MVVESAYPTSPRKDGDSHHFSRVSDWVTFLKDASEENIIDRFINIASIWIKEGGYDNSQNLEEAICLLAQEGWQFKIQIKKEDIPDHIIELKFHKIVDEETYEFEASDIDFETEEKILLIGFMLNELSLHRHDREYLWRFNNSQILNISTFLPEKEGVEENS